MSFLLLIATAHYMTGAGKRERESDHLLNNFSSLPINRFSKQQCVFPHHPQWLQTEKRQQPNSLVSTALHLSFSDNSRQQQRQDKLHGLRNQINTDRDRDREREEVGNLDLTAAINFHNDEIDSFLQVQVGNLFTFIRIAFEIGIHQSRLHNFGNGLGARRSDCVLYFYWRGDFISSSSERATEAHVRGNTKKALSCVDICGGAVCREEDARESS